MFVAEIGGVEVLSKLACVDHQGRSLAVVPSGTNAHAVEVHAKAAEILRVYFPPLRMPASQTARAHHSSSPSVHSAKVVIEHTTAKTKNKQNTDTVDTQSANMGAHREKVETPLCDVALKKDKKNSGCVPSDMANLPPPPPPPPHAPRRQQEGGAELSQNGLRDKTATTLLRNAKRASQWDLADDTAPEDNHVTVYVACARCLLLLLLS